MRPSTGTGGSDPVEIAATVLLALATVATAWSGYQASRWNGEQAKTAARANAARLESIRASGLADTQTQIDVATFTQWVDAYARKETMLADFYFRRFRPEFARAVDAWVATKPLRNPHAPLTPFAMPEYRLETRTQAARLQAEGEAQSALARSYIQHSTNYVLAVVLFASALFFAGVSTKPTSHLLRLVLLSFGVVVFVATLAWVAASPISLSV